MRYYNAVKQLYEVLAQDDRDDVFLQQLRVNVTKSTDRLRFARLERQLKRQSK